MSNLLTIVNDMIVIVFDLLFYILMFPTKTNKKSQKICIYGGCAAIITAYFMVTYIFGFPAAVSSAICMSIPSFFLFLYFAAYRDSRFVLTFCFIDSISLIVAFIGRAVGITLSHGELFAVLSMLLLFAVLLRMAIMYSHKYQKLLEEVDAGWGLMALASALIYFAMIFIAGYPKPMVERIEYMPVWLIFALVVIACYAVFIHSILKTKKISEQNKKLEREKEIYQMAYNDRLTGLYNRASYMDKVNELERRRKEFSHIGIAVIDINEFKKVNDTKGHYAGDQILKAAAHSLRTTFGDYKEYIFRMGGDEFLVILPGVSQEKMLVCISEFKQKLKEESAQLGAETTAAAGYVILSSQDSTSLESAYIIADKNMYLDKKTNYQKQ